MNGGFDSGVIAPWVGVNGGFTTTGPGPYGVTTSPGFPGAEGSAYYFATYLMCCNPATYTLTQTNVMVPSGTTVKCTGYAMCSHGGESPGTTTFTLTIDGQVCGSPLTLGDTDSYTQFGGNVLLIGDTHTVVVSWADSGNGDGNFVDYVDQFSILPISGPGVPSTC